jgi:hypothetical protein
MPTVVIGTDWATFAAVVSTGVVGLGGIAATVLVATQDRRKRESDQLYGSCVAVIRNVDDTLVAGRQALVWTELRPEIQARLILRGSELNDEATAALSALRPQLPAGTLIADAALKLVLARNAYSGKVGPGVLASTLEPLEKQLLDARERFIAELQRIVPPPRRWRRRSRAVTAEPVRLLSVERAKPPEQPSGGEPE